MTNSKGKSRGPADCSLGLSKNTELFLCHIHASLQERWSNRHQGNGYCSKGKAPQLLAQQNGSLQHYPACCWHRWKQQVKGKTLAKRINVLIEHTEHSKSQGSFQTHMMRKIRKRKRPKRKLLGFNLAQPAPPRAARFMRTDRKEPERLEPIGSEFTAQYVFKTKQTQTLNCWKRKTKR